MRNRFPLNRRLWAVAGVLLLCGPAARSAWGGGEGSPDDPAHDPFRQILKERARELDPRAAGIGRLLPDLVFEDFEGRPGRLSDYAESEALVIVVRQIGCPVGDRYAPRLARLEAEYAGRGVAFLYVNMDKFLEPEEVREVELGTHGFRGRYVHDPDESFGRALGVETTTPVFVLDRSRTLRYRGAVDDQYGRGVVLDAPRIDFLRDALERVLAHERVPVPATSAPGCALDIAREVSPPRPEDISFHREVERILQDNCIECHRDGGAAPFALESYEDVYDRRRMIRLTVDEKIMPPWYAADGTGPWKNDRRLSDEDRETVLAWVAADAPRGDPADAPVPLRWREGWLIGEPDLIFQLEEEKALPAEGVIEWDPIPGDVLVPEDIWVKRLQLLPGDPAVVHHCNVYFMPPADYGREGRGHLMDRLVPWKRRRILWQRLYTYLPGGGPVDYQPGVARFVPKGSRVVFDMHYTPSGKATVDRTRLGIVRADAPPRFSEQGRVVRAYDLQIAPGETVEFGAELSFPRSSIIGVLVPHMHLRARTFDAWLIRPDGSREELLSIPEWDPDWQFNYVLEEPLVLEAGSKIGISCLFDNSANNPNNPDPTQWVYNGPQTDDEMMLLGLQLIQPRAEREVFRGGWAEIPSIRVGAESREAMRAANEERIRREEEDR
jgi:thiol-disulfide isomerase/thioredoxin